MAQFVDTVNLSEDQWQRLVDRLDLDAKYTAPPTVDKSEKNRRDDPRFPFRRSNIPMILFADGKPDQRAISCSRNLSTGGIGLLHGRFVYSGTLAEIYLPLLDGTWIRRAGTIVHCRHITARLHELGCQFHDPIVLEPFIEKTVLEGNESDAALPDLTDRRILVMTDEKQASTVEDQLAEVGSTIFTAMTLDEAVEIGRKEEIELVLINQNAVRSNPEPIIGRLRAERYLGKIAVFGVSDKAGANAQDVLRHVEMAFPECVESEALVEGVAWLLKRPADVAQAA